jgi:uncharacterized protein YukE
MAINISILSSLDTKGFDKAVREFRNLEGATKKSAFAIKKAAIPAAAALASLATVAVIATKAFIADDAAQALLAGTLQRTTGATAATIAATEEYIETLSRASAVADEELRPALQTLLLGTKDLEIAQQLLGVALDVSTGTGLDLASVSSILSKGYAGNTKALKALSPEIAALIKGGATFSEVLTVLQTNFQGASDEAANSAAGGFAKLKIAVDETIEGIGEKLSPAIDVLLPYLLGISEWAQDNVGYIVVVGAAIGTIAAAVVLTSAGLAIWNAAAIITTAINAGLASSYIAVQIATGIGIVTAVAAVVAIGAAALKLKGILDKASKVPKPAKTITPIDPGLDKNADALKKTKDAAKALRDQLKTLKDAFRKEMVEAVQAANEVLNEAIDKFNEFASTVSDAVKSSYSFSDAQQSASDNLQAVAQASDDVAKAQDAVNKAWQGSDPEALTAAYDDLAAANERLRITQNAPLTFMENLRKQATKVKDFGVLINRLLAAGLSETNIQGVLAAGVDAGSAIANELLGSAGAILEANNLTAEVQSLADMVGVNSAAQFYQAGIDAGENLVAGIESIVSSYTISLNGARSAGSVASLTSGFRGAVGGAMAGTNPSGGFDVGGIATLAEGGIVNQATLAIIGEGNGPEAVIPLSQMGNMGGDTNVTIQVNGGDPQAVVDALRRYMQLNGSVPIRVSA